MACRELALCSVQGCGRFQRSSGQEWCDTHYYRVRRTGSLELLEKQPPERNCSVCGKPSKSRKHCSSKCEARDRRGCEIPACKVCGVGLVKGPKGRDPYTCSPSCLAEWKRRLSRQHYQRSMKTETGRNKYRAAEYRRKALKVAAYVEEVDWSVVMARDMWVCHLCLGPIDPAAVWPDPGFGTLDHVIPLSKCGSHSYENIKAAHLTCNCRKGNRTVSHAIGTRP